MARVALPCLVLIHTLELLALVSGLPPGPTRTRLQCPSYFRAFGSEAASAAPRRPWTDGRVPVHYGHPPAYRLWLGRPWPASGRDVFKLESCGRQAARPDGLGFLLRWRLEQGSCRTGRAWKPITGALPAWWRARCATCSCRRACRPARNA